MRSEGADKMGCSRLLTLLLAGAPLLLALTGSPALAERRIALVIGNSDYNDTSISLANPRNDAEDMAAALRALAFDVVMVTNASKRAVDGAVEQFARLGSEADSVVFYYAGHAMQYQGRNYLMPVDATLVDEISLRYNMVSFDDIRAAMSRTRGIKVMILDACRNNPLAERFERSQVGANRGGMGTRGLARIDTTAGTVVSYATAADNVAIDGTGRNSPYTTALLRRLQEPGLEIEMMFRRVAADVNAETKGRQRPETYVSLLGEYYLNQSDRVLWEQVEAGDDPDAVRAFLARFPSSSLALSARTLLQSLEQKQAARPDAAAVRITAPEPRPTAAPELRPIAAPEPRPIAAPEPRPIAAPEPPPVVTTPPQAVLLPPVDASLPGEVTPRNVRPDVVAPSAPAAGKVAAASANRNRRQNVNCGSILERAQLGELSADDHALLQKECR
jgi:hypothetical protein